VDQDLSPGVREGPGGEDGWGGGKQPFPKKNLGAPGRGDVETRLRAMKVVLTPNLNRLPRAERKLLSDPRERGCKKRSILSAPHDLDRKRSKAKNEGSRGDWVRAQGCYSVGLLQQTTYENL